MTDTTDYGYYTSTQNPPEKCYKCGGMVYPAYFPDDGELQDGPLRPEFYCICGGCW